MTLWMLLLIIFIVIISTIASIFACLAFFNVRGMRQYSERLERMMLDEFHRGRQEQTESLRNANDSTLKAVNGISENQLRQLSEVTRRQTELQESNRTLLEKMRQAMEDKLMLLQRDNSEKLEQMRATVDEKLQNTLEKRLGESFKIVSERLEQVYKGLGEMQTLANGVGDLKRVLTNVKSRGTWGEIQLAAMLEQVLTPEQYVCNFSPKQTASRVEFAIRMPGRSGDNELYLPIDAKFPIEDYQRLLDAEERADADAATHAIKQLEARIKDCAKDIQEKYINPPITTDFAILYLPMEGLFAEVIRRPALCEMLQQKFRVVVAGPTTLWSILTSLQMGFRTLAIEQRSSDVWKLLEAVKSEWIKYGEALDAVQKRIQAASESISKAQTRVTAIGKKLRTVQEPLNAEEAEALLDANE